MVVLVIHKIFMFTSSLQSHLLNVLDTKASPKHIFSDALREQFFISRTPIDTCKKGTIVDH